MKPLRIVHFEDSSADATLIRHKIKQAGIEAEVVRVTSPAEFQEKLAEANPGVIVVDNGIPGFSGLRAIEVARECAAGIPVIILSGAASEQQVAACMAAGVQDYVLKGHWWQLFAALRRAQASAAQGQEKAKLEQHDRGMSQLVSVLQKLSSAQDVSEVMQIVVAAARQLTGADGAAFVLRENTDCHYGLEEGSVPSRTGQRFPLNSCISGWVMLKGRSVAIQDVHADARIPADALCLARVSSLAAAPVGVNDVVGAIEVFWTESHMPERAEVEILEALANTAAVVMENIQLCGELDRRVRERTMQLEDAVRELESFSYSVSHDLRSPLQTVAGFAELVALNVGAEADPVTHDYVAQIRTGVNRMTRLVDDLLRLAQIGNAHLQLEDVDLSALANEKIERVRNADPRRHAQVSVQPGMIARCDRGLMRVVLQNLISNAWKFTARCEIGKIDVGCAADEKHGRIFHVRDNGAGFDPAAADKLFTPFQRLHSEAEFAGTGVGLATVQRVIHRHAGQIWATGEPNRGASFFFTLPEPRL
jgi:signal transduction histidine kinase/DNA-binding response OmpR family regulator